MWFVEGEVGRFAEFHQLRERLKELGGPDFIAAEGEWLD